MTRRRQVVIYATLNVTVVATGMLRWVTGRTSGFITLVSLPLAIIAANAAAGAGFRYRKGPSGTGRARNRRRAQLWLGSTLCVLGLVLGAWALISDPIDIKSAGFGAFFVAYGVFMAAHSRKAAAPSDGA
jgi:hypothetical protein